MVFRVELSRKARRDLDRILARLIAEAPVGAGRWVVQLERMIESLALFPERFPVDTTVSTERHKVRKAIFGKRRFAYRIYYLVAGTAVTIVHVRHGARKDPRRVM